MMRMLKQLKDDESGQDLVEYALLAALLAMVSVAGLNTLGPIIAGFYESIVPLFGI